MNLLFGGSAILSATEEDFAANGELNGVKQAGQPFNTLGPHISPIVVSWTTHVHSRIVVEARIIQSFIRGRDFSAFASPSDFRPIAFFCFSLSA